jgi:hypothetical protein
MLRVKMGVDYREGAIPKGGEQEIMGKIVPPPI